MRRGDPLGTATIQSRPDLTLHEQERELAGRGRKAQCFRLASETEVVERPSEHGVPVIILRSEVALRFGLWTARSAEQRELERTPGPTGLQPPKAAIRSRNRLTVSCPRASAFAH